MSFIPTLKRKFLLPASIVLLALLAGQSNGFAQTELLKNGSFNRVKRCPFYMGTLNQLLNWNSPNEATPDFAAHCTPQEERQEAFSEVDFIQRDGVVGLVTFTFKGKKDWREYLQTKLDEPLKVGHEYVIEFEYLFSQRSGLGIDSLQLVFCDQAHAQSNNKSLKLKGNSEEVAVSLTENKGAWQIVQVRFVPTVQGLSHLVVGNFKGDKEIISGEHFKIYDDQDYKGAYYLFDNFTLQKKQQVAPLEELADESELVVEEEEKEEEEIAIEIVEEKPDFTFSAMTFEAGKSKINPAAKAQLEAFAKTLLQVDSKIRIEGHTDSTGNEAHNEALSNRRSETIAASLIRLGIAKDRISIKGWGSAKPKANNETEEGRALNRRVEVFVEE